MSFMLASGLGGGVSAAGGTAAAGASILGTAAAAAGPIGLAVSAISQLAGGIQAKKQAEKAAELEAKATQESFRNIYDEARADLTSDQFSYIASGVRNDTGSPLMIAAEKARAYKREGAIVQEVGATRAAATKAQGRAALTQGVGGFASSMSQLASWKYR